MRVFRFRRAALILLCCVIGSSSLFVFARCRSIEQPQPCYVHLNPPEQFQPKMQVAGCYCEYDGKILMLLRSPHKPQGNTWCAPGGKLESAESPEQAVIRELKEEINLDITGLPLSYCRRVFVRFPQVDFVLHLYRVRLNQYPNLTIAHEEHLDYCWVSPQEALELPLIPGGDECVEVVYGISSAPQLSSL